MNLRALALVAGCLGGASYVRMSGQGRCADAFALLAMAAAVWLAYRALVASRDGQSQVVLRLWGLDWTRDEACCHFFITGATGTGKTARAVVPIVHGLRTTLPETGILAVDSKGALWTPLQAMAKSLGQEHSLRLIRVRPTHIPPEQWIPPLRLNLIGDPAVPWSTYAKVIVDTATAAGQRGGQSFFKETARDVITHAMHALELAGMPVTLANVHDAICISTETALLLERLAEQANPAAAVECQYFKDFAEQPPEQKSGTVFTVAAARCAGGHTGLDAPLTRDYPLLHARLRPAKHRGLDVQVFLPRTRQEVNQFGIGKGGPPIRR